MSSGRTFNVAAKRKAAEGNEHKVYEPVEYTFTDDSPIPGKEPIVRKVLFNHPGENALMLLAASGGEGVESLQSLFTIMRRALSPLDYNYIKGLVAKEELEAGDLMDMLRDAMEDWSGFPTQPSSDSPPSPAPTGGRSTGRARPAVSTS